MDQISERLHHYMPSDCLIRPQHRHSNNQMETQEEQTRSTEQTNRDLSTIREPEYATTNKSRTEGNKAGVMAVVRISIFRFECLVLSRPSQML
jgi:hypothetical protein